MSIWNKILVGLIGVASVVLFYMAARALKTETEWSKYAQDHQRIIRRLEKDNYTLSEGTETEPGVRQLRVELHNLLLDRRRMWSDCDPRVKKVGPDPNATEITVVVNQTDSSGQRIPHGIAKKTVLYAFEKADIQKKGQYLGEFKVTNVGEKQVDIAPTARLTPREIDKLSRAKRPWVLYEILPRDNHEVFASLSDADKKAMLPAGAVREYLKDGKPSEKDDPSNQVVDGKYVRRLLDYGVLFNNEREKYALLTDSILAAQQDKQLVKEALTEAQAEADARARDIASTAAEKEKMQHERDVVAALRQKIEGSLRNVEEQIARLTQTNQAMAGQIAKFQLEAARRIDQRTRAMVQSGDAGRL